VPIFPRKRLDERITVAHIDCGVFETERLERLVFVEDLILIIEGIVLIKVHFGTFLYKDFHLQKSVHRRNLL
jgi:hypothetical protein